MTPMTMPAIAPPDRPCALSAAAPVRVMFAPVATGARKGTVVEGDEVAVTITKVLLVGRMAGEIPEVALEVPAPAAAAHCPEVRQYWSLAQHILPQDDSPLSQLQLTEAVGDAAAVEGATQTEVATPPPPTTAGVEASPHHELPVLNLVMMFVSVCVSTQELVQYFQ
jgi:hypothetical protein